MAKDNRPYHMKRRRYGWGWTPVTWQAVFIIVAQIAIIFIAATFLPTKPAQPMFGEIIAYFAIVALAIATLVIFSMISAPKPTWRWGKKAGDNSNEDF